MGRINIFFLLIIRFIFIIESRLIIFIVTHYHSNIYRLEGYSFVSLHHAKNDFNLEIFSNPLSHSSKNINNKERLSFTFIIIAYYFEVSRFRRLSRTIPFMWL
jgi:hypothetical protein